MKLQGIKTGDYLYYTERPYSNPERVHALADACRLLVAAIEQIHGKCQTREQRAALIIGREALAALQRQDHD